ncbi:hypothetical protein MelnitzEXVC044M_89 [Methylophilales phage Melnitz EXVC044M]|nr:hypothetical protein Melnitz1EXVC043M_88 [Methylophilales phage Melnitz-1 EXVC043M]QZI94596.1 hypothetical protein Melnitz2EXVC040M_89 [Methylophilales phage Melnitz-2 EXVC040M]QZI94818.1 hypothetical protein MelnitzEXVC044M_89 [Methylophilales phage Melnitz EXVC044M]QZI95039.1 hypothetical protein Melnitz3EXVC039M_89 [Methylophilales phage Melnitz-3 EXVC039M]
MDYTDVLRHHPFNLILKYIKIFCLRLYSFCALR